MGKNIEEIMANIEEKMFYTNELNNIIFEILEDLEELTASEFIDNFEYKLDTDAECSIAWEIVKNYTDINYLQRANFETIKQEFYSDIEKFFQ